MIARLMPGLWALFMLGLVPIKTSTSLFFLVLIPKLVMQDLRIVWVFHEVKLILLPSFF